MIKLSGLSEKEPLEIIPEHTLLLGYVGSIAHGTYVPKNDPEKWKRKSAAIFKRTKPHRGIFLF
ncbi:MAG: hypothetical protein PHC61_04770 [Chitinivibrionales bacterium]|nr:hypothetical protein [Chitinivibrionales bacterium]